MTQKIWSDFHVREGFFAKTCFAFELIGITTGVILFPKTGKTQVCKNCVLDDSSLYNGFRQKGTSRFCPC